MAEAVKLHVRKGDTVVVLTGKDKGKEGKVLAAFPKKSKVTVEGVNEVKRHTKPSQSNPQGGIVTKEAAISFQQSDAGLPQMQETDPHCTQDGKRQIRPICKHCGEVLDK
jgi:large subunit ribosomal protein L24